MENHMEKKSAWEAMSKKEQENVFAFAEGYKTFLKQAKTERMAIAYIIKTLKKQGFKEISTLKKAKSGDRVYKIIKEKVVVAFIVGKDKENWRLVGSHVDSPRLDLKPHPLYEDVDLAVLKTHYYGGIKKYQWVNVPLALHGVIFTKKGKRVEIHIGEKEEDPKFVIPDLLPHLAREQLERDAKKIVQGEELNVLVGNIPVASKKDKKEVKEKVKAAVLEHLKKEYGIIEEDFTVAELQFVPAVQPADIGFDRAMIGAYSHDDHVCVYASLQALIQTKTPKTTAVGFFVDKEEIGSYGDTGASSYLLQNAMTDYRELVGAKQPATRIFERAKAISADVTAAIDPTFKDVHDLRNVSHLGRGVSIEKYGGGGGKYSTHDAHAEYMQELRAILDKHGVHWQTGELGRIDLGGGGTIGMFLSRYGMDCVDAGPAVLSMHAPFELVAKSDVHEAYRFYKAFYNE